MKTIRQSSFQAGLSCRRAFQLSQSHQSDPSNAMKFGIAFECILFDYESKDYAKHCLNMDGSLKKTYHKVKDIAIATRNLFGKGTHHTRLYADVEGKKISGEPDFVGWFVEKQCDSIVDLKWTGDIAKIWNYKTTKEDFFQAVSYTFLVYINTGKLLPFYYFIIQPLDGGDYIFRIIEIKVTQKDIEWFLGVVRTLVNDNLLIPDTSKCLGSGRFDPPCRYLADCEHGRDMLGGTETITFSDLQCDFEIDPAVNEQEKFTAVIKEQKKTGVDFLTDTQGELEESDIDSLIETGTAKKLDSLTYGKEETEGKDVIKCRNCRTMTIKKGVEQCQNCHTKIVWF